jgi:hypothetical protein
MALRDDRYWNRDFEMGLPDSRLSGMARERRRVFFRGQWMERVYCANCGADGGALTADWSPFMFYLCNECAAKNGDPSGAQRVTEEDEKLARGL